MSENQITLKDILIPKEYQDNPNIWFYNNPLNIQLSVLELLRQRLNGKYFVADPNNTFMFVLEAFSNIISDACNDIQNKLITLYPAKTNRIYDLFQHLTDFDYVGLFATPSVIEIELILDYDHIVNNALPYDDYYNAVIIPRTTIFMLDKIPFGLYYDILIKINKITKNIIVEYDVNQPNPLHPLKDFTLDKKIYRLYGKKYLSIKIPIYQFLITFKEETTTQSYGFNKRYIYNNQFYAVRIYNNQYNEWKELSITTSDFNYDPNVPTAIIKPYTDVKELHIEIPKVYFNTNLVTSKFLIELYTTLGNIYVPLSNLNADKFLVTFNKYNFQKYIPYVSILKTCPVLQIKPISSVITGGTNGTDFQTLKQQIINRAHELPITDIDISIMFEKYNYSWERRKDDITQRVYYAIKKLYREQYTPLTTTYMDVHIEPINISDYYNIEQKEDNIIVYPGAVFDVNISTNYAVPLTNDKISELNSLKTNNILYYTNLINNSNYFFNPYLIIIHDINELPTGTSYDLSDTDISYVFYKENAAFDAEIDIAEILLYADITQKKYVISMACILSDDIKDYAPQITPTLYITTAEGNNITYKGQYVNSDDLYHYYTIDIKTDFVIEKDDKLHIDKEGFDLISGIIISDYCRLHIKDQKGIIVFSIPNVNFSNVPTDPSIQNLLPLDMRNDYISIVAYQTTMKFCSNLKDYLDTNVYVGYNEIKYKTYEEDIPLTYEHDVYERNPDGTLKYEIYTDPDTGEKKVILFKLHSKGDIVYDEEGNIIYKHRKGDIMLDENGNPIIDQDRSKFYSISIIGFDYKYYILNMKQDLIFDQLKTIYTQLSEMSNKLMDNTKLYFKPAITKAYINIPISQNTYKTIPSSLSFKFDIYIYKNFINDNNVKDYIRKFIIENLKYELDKNKFDINAFVKKMTDALSEYIHSITQYGINNDQLLQAITIDEPSKFLSLKEILIVLDEDKGILDLDYDVNVTYFEAPIEK